MASSRAKAKVKPALITWARRSARVTLEDAAASAKVDPTDLAAWEAGTDGPSIAQLRKLAAIYRRPIVVFYLPTPPKDFDALRDFRRVPGDQASESPHLAAEIRWAREMREVVLEACAVTETAIPDVGLSAKLDDSPIEVAKKARGVLGVEIGEGRRWANPYEGFNRWRGAIEDRGVLCLQFSGVEVSEARAFAAPDVPLPVVAVNTKDAITARLFSMLHEFAHLLIGQAGKCDLHESGTGDDRDRIETFCNAVAARILVPDDALRADLPQPVMRRLDWSDDELRALARPYGVSREVVLRRLLDSRADHPGALSGSAKCLEGGGARQSVGRGDKLRRQLLQQYESQAGDGAHHVRDGCLPRRELHGERSRGVPESEGREPGAARERGALRPCPPTA